MMSVTIFSNKVFPLQDANSGTSYYLTVVVIAISLYVCNLQTMNLLGKYDTVLKKTP